jgi:hypothetical protein
MELEVKPIPPLSMYTITAMLFKHIEMSVVTSYGEHGKKLLAVGVSNFGYTHAQDIVVQANQEGEGNVLESYIPETFVHEDKYGKLTIYRLMAKLFAHVSKAVVVVYGEEGKHVIRDGVRAFGEKRGKGIAERARHMGKPNTIENYLSNYDMGRSDLFEYESIFKPELIEQTFTKCPFGQQWADDDMHEYGILYCQMIDPAIAKGYNPEFEVEHDQYVLKEGVCHFNFKLKKNNVD